MPIFFAQHQYIPVQIKWCMTVLAKTGFMGTNTEIHFLPVDKSCTHALSSDTKHLRLDGQVCFFRRLFYGTVKP